MQFISGFKPGNSFSFNYALPIAFGSTVDEVICKVAVANGAALTVISTLTVVKVADTVTSSNWRVSATPGQTASWPQNNLQCDVKNIIGSDVISTDTFIISTAQGIS
jgi:hypothetical protein